ncbi:Z1 domain-containing protein [Streptomyces nigrescens]|uniref:Endonuclease n=2 Tax=Streptomyces nigrescens TaxID=1920 RepID=A0A640TPR1_STRNI|nr:MULTISPECIES: Z1 domain-containing protein [Streptomyces]WAT98519.1 Z1 domain-containing protein [Streptomyces libani subsp. libani]WAU06493.1 Z1 domain-containing protein [Streptomyces nigrescens]GFE24146.1 endonuclease [Streptomyces libani subsp. libani]GGW00010.1 endonuclease [Streptomyces libani subsp. libani]
MADEFDGMYDTFKAILETFPPTESVKRLEQLGISTDIIQRIRDRHEQQTIRIKELEEPHAVILGNRDTWYTGPQAKDKFWPAIMDLLQKDGWPQKPAIDSLDESSTRIVSLLNHPREKAFSTRGLVVGHVQSGKTTNFTSVMAKAADRGYKLFIVLAGIHNGLRRQTQARLIQQLVEPNPTMWSQLTGLDKDFTPQENPASYFGKSNKTHVVCVVKKNATVLRKLARWLDKASAYLQDCPALIIDDEADQATVATKSINPLILNIMGCLPKCGYVGYTASPFANLLIDPTAEDLYPKDFVVNLPKPQGHFGTEVLFGRYALDGEDPEQVDDGHDMIRSIPEGDVACVRPESKADVDGFEPIVADTLREAVEYFWLVTAARRVRGTGNPHNTMLIHTSVNTSVHNSFKTPLKNLRDRSEKALTDPDFLAHLRNLWERETSQVAAEGFGEKKVPFEQLLSELPGVLGSCRVIMDNSSSEDRLDYANGPVVAIAVGGNTLSRGLTLEGLSVSYFVRSVSAYDTLLQMGRWFGFRHGYADLPRIWMTDELAEWFRHLATVETEMRRDIDVYMTEDENPRTFAVRLRTHPALRVTSAAKMRDSVTAASSYGGKRVQTHYFHTNAEWLGGNLEAARTLTSAASAHAVRVENRSAEGRYVFRDVPSDLVIDFLSTYRFHEKSPENDADLLTGYIRKRISTAGSLRRWNVAIVGNSVGAEENNLTFARGVTVGRITRARIAVTNPAPDFADIKTLMSRRDAAIDLAGNTAQLSEKAIMDLRREQLPDKGLLILYPIDKLSAPSPSKKLREPLNAEEHVIGVGLVFPEPRGTDSTVQKYISADLSNVRIEDEDYSLLDSEEV